MWVKINDGHSIIYKKIIQDMKESKLLMARSIIFKNKI